MVAMAGMLGTTSLCLKPNIRSPEKAYNGSHMSRFTVIALAALLVSAPLADARIVRIEIENRESPAYEGKAFGKAGQYDLLTGHFYGALDPAAPENATIND